MKVKMAKKHSFRVIGKDGQGLSSEGKEWIPLCVRIVVVGSKICV